MTTYLIYMNRLTFKKKKIFFWETCILYYYITYYHLLIKWVKYYKLVSIGYNMTKAILNIIGTIIYTFDSYYKQIIYHIFIKMI